jgi:hypothetical protein
MVALLKQNEIRSLLKMWAFLMREFFLTNGGQGGSRRAETVFNFN